MAWLIVYILTGILIAEAVTYGNRKLKTKNVMHKNPVGYTVLVLFWPVVLVAGLFGRKP